jgi:hypothetical protein
MIILHLISEVHEIIGSKFGTENGGNESATTKL